MHPLSVFHLKKAMIVWKTIYPVYRLFNFADSDCGIFKNRSFIKNKKEDKTNEKKMKKKQVDK